MLECIAISCGHHLHEAQHRYLQLKTMEEVVKFVDIEINNRMVFKQNR